MDRRGEMVELIGRLGDGPEGGMVAVARLREMLDQERLVQVGGARRAGWSWAAVGRRSVLAASRFTACSRGWSEVL